MLKGSLHLVKMEAAFCIPLICEFTNSCKQKLCEVYLIKSLANSGAHFSN